MEQLIQKLVVGGGVGGKNMKPKLPMGGGKNMKPKLPPGGVKHETKTPQGGG